MSHNEQKKLEFGPRYIEGRTNKQLQLHKIGHQAMDLFSLDIHIKELKKKIATGERSVLTIE